ncbi:MAG: hypothetical protein ACLR01_03065 [Vescimonas sp.]
MSCTRWETYHKVKGKKLPWDDYKTPRFDDEAIQAIRDVADKYDIPVELITKLIVSVDTNKHITKNNKMQKAFDSIIGQGLVGTIILSAGAMRTNERLGAAR